MKIINYMNKHKNNQTKYILTLYNRVMSDNTVKTYARNHNAEIYNK